MNLVLLNKQFDDIKKVEREIEYRYEPRITKEDPKWKRHMFYSELKDEFIKEVSSYGFCPFIEDTYDAQRKNKNIMKFRLLSYNQGMMNYVRKKYDQKPNRCSSADVSKKRMNIISLNEKSKAFLSKAFRRIDMMKNKKLHRTGSLLFNKDVNAYDSSFSLHDGAVEQNLITKSKSKTNKSKTSFFTSSRNISSSNSGRNKFIFRNSIVNQTELKNMQKEKLNLLKEKYFEMINNKSKIHPLVSFMDSDNIKQNLTINVLKDYIVNGNDTNKKRNIEVIKQKSNEVMSTNFVSRFERSKSFIMSGNKVDKMKRTSISMKYLNNEKNTIPEKKHNSHSAFLEKLEKAPKGIFKLAVFQRRRDEYYQKLLDEEDRLCDDYKIK